MFIANIMPKDFQKIEKYIHDCAQKVDEELDFMLHRVDESDLSTMYEAMRYSTMSGGKRLRPFLLISIADTLGVSRDLSLKFACVVELIHAYSLVHDDLPAMDNDDIRRGKPSCHKKFSESTAILTGNALLTKAFEIASEPTNELAEGRQLLIITEIAKAAGILGLLGGQFLDLNLSLNNIDYPTITRINSMKTGAMFSICCTIAILLSNNASKSVVHHMNMYAKSIGSAFQILDDILDYDSDSKKSENGKIEMNIVSIVGLEQAQQELNILIEQAIEMLNIFDNSHKNVLVEFAKYIRAKAR